METGMDMGNHRRGRAAPAIARRAAQRVTGACAAGMLAVGITAGLVAIGAAGQALAQTGPFPNRPIKMIVASTAGGILDTVGRTVATGLAETLGQPVVVENRPGAGGSVGSEQVAKGAADGYTLLLEIGRAHV